MPHRIKRLLSAGLLLGVAAGTGACDNNGAVEPQPLTVNVEITAEVTKEMVDGLAATPTTSSVQPWQEALWSVGERLARLGSQNQRVDVELLAQDFLPTTDIDTTLQDRLIEALDGHAAQPGFEEEPAALLVVQRNLLAGLMCGALDHDVAASFTEDVEAAIAEDRLAASTGFLSTGTREGTTPCATALRIGALQAEGDA